MERQPSDGFHALTDTDIDVFYSRISRHSDPDVLLHSLYQNNMTYFGLRANQEHLNLCWGDVIMGCDPESGDNFLELRTERVTKTRQGENPRNRRQVNPKSFANLDKPERCPVATYLLYKQRRPEGYCNPNDQFYVAVKNNTPKSIHDWYKKQPVGIHKLASFVKVMVNAANIGNGRHLKNTSYRKHLAAKLNEGCVPKDVGRHVTGHKQAASLDNYAALSMRQQRVLSTIVGGSKTPQDYPQAICHAQPVYEACTSSTVCEPPGAGTLMMSSLPLQDVSGHQASAAATMMPTLFSGAQVQGGTFNIQIHHHEHCEPARKKRIIIIDTDSEKLDRSIVTENSKENGYIV